MTAADRQHVIPECGLWDECGEWIWIARLPDDDELRVKRRAWRGDGLPYSPAREGADYRHTRIRPVTVRPGEPDEHGWAGAGADTWWLCEPGDPRGVPAWEISFA